MFVVNFDYNFVKWLKETRKGIRKSLTMVLTLYKLDPSPPVRAVYMTIHALNIPDVNLVDVNLFESEHLKEDYLKLNPQHSMPTLTDEDFAIWDSHAISTYLVTVYGSDDSLYPNDPKKRAIVDQRLHFDSGILFPYFRSVVDPIFFQGEKAARPEALENVKKAYDFTNKFLTTATWLAGDDLTLADICCVATISSLNELLPVKKFKNEFPNLLVWFKRCAEQDFYQIGNAPGLDNFSQMLKAQLE